MIRLTCGMDLSGKKRKRGRSTQGLRQKLLNASSMKRSRSAGSKEDDDAEEEEEEDDKKAAPMKKRKSMKKA